jgi:adenylosuccinate synthase
VTEDNSLPIPSCHNGQNEWQGAFRIGWFDAVAARYALEAVGGVDTLAITNLDRMRALRRLKVAIRYSGTDERFFSREGDRMFVQDNDLKLLAERTGTMQSLVPVYHETPGFGVNTERGVEKYLDTLALLLGHQVRAYSESIDHRKVYRCS